MLYLRPVYLFNNTLLLFLKYKPRNNLIFFKSFVYKYYIIETYSQMSDNEPEWKQVTHDFKMLWDFDNCLGAIGGKHILINNPPNSGSYYYNYKGTFSVKIFAVVNSNYEFIYVLSSINGRVLDGGILKETYLYKLLVGNNLKIPSL